MVTPLLAALLIHKTAPPSTPQQEPRTVTLTAQAEPLSEVLKTLSQTTGQNLSAHPVLAAEPVILHVQELPYQTLLDQIAWATGGTWEAREDGLHLKNSRPTPQQIAQRQTRERLQRLAEEFDTSNVWNDQTFSNSLDSALTEFNGFFQKFQSGTPVSPEELERFRSLERILRANAPHRRLYLQLAQKIGLDNLVELPLGETVTITSLQQDSLGLSQGLLRLREQLNQWLLKKGTPAVNQHQHALLGLEQWSPHSDDVAIVKITANKEGFKFTGYIFSTDQPFIQAIPDWETTNPEAQPASPAPRTPPVEGNFTPTPEALSLYQVFGRIGDTSDQTLQQVRRLVATPYKPDFLQSYEAEALIAAARQLDRNLIAVIPDSFSAQWMNNSLHNLDLSLYILYARGVEVQETENHWSIRPQALPQGEPYRLDRTALKALIGSLDANEDINVETFLESLSAVPPDQFTDFDSRLGSLLFNLKSNLGYSYINSELAALNPAQRASLLNNGELKVSPSALAPWAYQRLNARVQGAWSHTYEYGDAWSSWHTRSGVSSDLKALPIFVLPNGVKDLTVRYRYRKEDIVSVLSPTAQRGHTEMTLEEFVRAHYPTFDPTQPKVESATGYTVQQRAVFIIDHLAPNNTGWRTVLTYPLNLKTAAPQSFDNPPPAVRETIARLKTAEENPEKETPPF